MKANRTFLTLLAVLLLVVVGGVFIILMSIANHTDTFGDPASTVSGIAKTNEFVETAIHATETAKSYTLTPTKQR